MFLVQLNACGCSSAEERQLAMLVVGGSNPLTRSIFLYLPTEITQLVDYSMIVFPAVDIKKGCCVRLQKGKPDTAVKYFEKPWKAARQWEISGAQWLHVVNLDGALTQSLDSNDAVTELITKSNLKIQLGGGVRSHSDINKALNAGVEKVVVGTKAVKDPEWTITQCQKHPGKIVVALDAQGDYVSVEGWQANSNVTILDLARKLQSGPPAAYLYTDVERDGMLSQPNFDGVERLLNETHIPVIASGGVSCLEDIKQLGNIGADGVITGKALYENKFRLEEALDIASLYTSRLEN